MEKGKHYDSISEVNVVKFTEAVDELTHAGWTVEAIVHDGKAFVAIIRK